MQRAPYKKVPAAAREEFPKQEGKRMKRTSGKVSLYVQVKQQMRARMENGQWPSNSKIPGEHELAAQFGISRATVRKALDELELEGAVTRRVGDGTYVSVPKIDQRLGSFYSFSTEVRAMGMTASTTVMDFVVIQADPMLQSRMRLEPEALVYRIRRLRMADGIPFALETSFVPYSLCPKLTRELVDEYGLYEALRNSAGLQPDAAQETFEAVLLSREEALYLQCPVPSAALRLERLTTAGDALVEYCVSVVRGDRYKYNVLLR